MDLSSKKIGIWGFGIVGKSVANYLYSRNYDLEVLEKRNLTELEVAWCKERDISFFAQAADLESFLNHNDIIVPSPGIDLSSVAKYKDKFLSELDLFALHFNKPIIAITGTLGKTSTTHLLTTLLCMQGIRAVAAGNIGLGMCDLLFRQDEIDNVVLEISSFQLECSNVLKPAIAIWTNLYPNHLDRHGDMSSYFDAKFMIMSKQDEFDCALVPFNLIKEIYKKNPSCKLNFFSINPVFESDFALLKQGDSLFYISDENIYKYHASAHEFIYPLKNLPEITFVENWLMICAAFYLNKTQLNIDVTKLDIPEHRLEKFAQKGDVEFYNDSKSTVPEATLAAVSKFKTNNIILFLGGLSKGFDRSIMIKELKDKVKTIICFGAEAEQLKDFCDLNTIPAYKSKTLEEAVDICMKIACDKDKVIFSPAGSSYDLFTIYTERGKAFKQLVNKEIAKRV
ncbi:MAG: UDP-N-acetylmuramoyl-L-alanine--D-glutamate ligase [Candidatus Babeliales bacterium]|nr:UDP-N-acetylmuramoyl-L-alanine--D-glutamate ligase [Candidatus Babeliales bacterium]